MQDSEKTEVMPPTPEKDSFVGTQVGEYIVEKKIGEGGMGEVWLGRHPLIGKRVAIKLLSERLINNKKIVARFRREAMAVNQIQHQNLVDIFSMGELPNGQPYLVMEFLEGKTLKAYLEEKKYLPFGEILHISGQICRAVDAAHEQGIIHRDLKPDNIFLLLDKSGGPPFVKILDFGIAKLAGGSEDGQHLTRTGVPFGTPAYMSPEQCEGAKYVDHYTDIYALGIILFEMITGRTPFYEPGDGVGKVWARHKLEPAPKPSSMVSGRTVPEEVDNCILRALAKDPKDRPASCVALYDELVRAVGTLRIEDWSDLRGAESALQLQKEKPGKMPTGILSAQIHTQGFDPVRTGYYTGAAETTSPPSSSRSKALIGAGAVLGVAALGVGLYLLLLPEAPPPKAASSVPTAPPLATTTEASPPPPQTAPVVSTPEEKAETVSLSVISDPAGAEVFLDDELLGRTPLEQYPVPYGTRELKIRIEKEGYETKEYKFTPTASYHIDPTLIKAKPEAKQPKSSKNTENKGNQSNKNEKNNGNSNNQPFDENITFNPFNKK